MTLMKMPSFSKIQDDQLPEDMSIIFPMPSLVATEGHANPTRGHCRSLSAPAEASAAAPWDLSPGTFQHLKENWQGWKWKMMKKNNGDKKKRALYDRRVALEEDVAQLQTQLKTEKAVRQGLERALGHGKQSKRVPAPPPCEIPVSTFSPKAKELITEIANLETEVASLEHHVLSLYRKVLDTQICPSPTLSSVSSVHNVPNLSGLSTPTESVTPPKEARLFSKMSLKRKSTVLTSSHRRNVSANTPGGHETPQEASTGQTKSRHASLLGGAFNCIDGRAAEEIAPQSLASIPLEPTIVLHHDGRVEVQEDETSRQPSRKETFSEDSTPIALLTSGPHSAPASESGFGKYSESPRLYPGTPNRLSEELVRCMAAIYCKLADPPLSQNPAPISPSCSSSSSASSTSTTTTSSSPRGFSSDSWSPRWQGADSSSDQAASLPDPFQLKERKGDVVGSYSSAVEVPWICVDKDRLTYAARALRNFRSMVEQLEKVDPGVMMHDEKMAFWINVYNALMMHAYLAYGIPRSHLKRLSLVQKASYKVGPHSINAHMIEHCILGCRSRRPTQWLQTFFTTAARFKAGDERKAYALDKPEPLVCFALCCGGRSDPAIRVYSAKNVREELEMARREYLQASIGIRSGSKVFLPRILEWYARETAVAPGSLLQWVCQHVSEKQQAAIKVFLQSKPHKNVANCVEWLPYNSSFRYIFVRDLARLAPLTSQ